SARLDRHRTRGRCRARRALARVAQPTWRSPDRVPDSIRKRRRASSWWTRYSNEGALMLAGTETLATIANHWLARFEHALAEGDSASLERLFDHDSHWRDVLALTWRIDTLSGASAIARELL